MNLSKHRQPGHGGGDRYKRSSYRTYNSRKAKRYDSSLAVQFYRPELMDDAVLEELGSEVPSLAILDVGCATGRLLRRLADAGAHDLAGIDLVPAILETARASLS